MKVEPTSDLGNARLAIPVAYIVLGCDIIGVALLAWSSSSDWRAFGALVVGISLGLLCGPRLRIWKV